MPRVMPRVSTTSTTGAASSFASAALLSDPSTATPSCSPLFPSIRARSASAPWRTNSIRISPGPMVWKSRFRQLRPAAAVSHIGSM